MPELPESMLQKDRLPDQNFAPEEHLYRRVRPDDWDDEEIELDAIDFPDMSVTRQKYGKPDSARWVGANYLNWGVIGFQVQDIPREIPFQGAVIYRMRPVHMPNKRNYPHSEVQVFEAPWDQQHREKHLDKASMPGVPREAQQEWRERLRRASRAVLRPGEDDVE